MARPRLRILVGIDFSPESLRALRVARALAAKAGASVMIAHVRPTSAIRAAVLEERGDLLRANPHRISSAIARHYETLLRAIRSGGRFERTVLLRGVPARALSDHARRGFDLMVLGSRGRGRVAAFLLGSTVQEVLRRSPVPVVVTR